MANGFLQVTNRRSLITSFASIAVFMFLDGTASQIASAQQTKKPFSVADEIGIVLFGAPSGTPPELHFSPDGQYVAVWTQRGQLDLNRVEESLRFYRGADIGHFLGHFDDLQPPAPVWVVNRSAKKARSIGSAWRWLSDSSGVAFLERTGGDNNRLVLADLRKKTVEPLTSAMETIKAFDIRDRRHYAYTIETLVGRAKRQAERGAPAMVVTGRSLYELLFPDEPREVSFFSGRCYLWAAVDGKPFEVKHDRVPVASGQGLGVFDFSLSDLALSPDGRSLVTTLSLREVPSSWETLYPPPYPSYQYRIHAGKNYIGGPVRQYVRIDLRTGSVHTLTDAPTSNDGGWFASGGPSWSSDGHDILLPGTFIKSKDNAPSRPCVAVVDLPSNTRTCVEMLKGPTETGVEEGYHQITQARFADGDQQRVLVSFRHREDNVLLQTIEYRHMADGKWKEIDQIKGWSEVGHNGLEVTVKQAFNEPPVLVATNKEASRVIWDPNPQLKILDLGQASLYRWKNKEGKEWKGGLFKPSDYKAVQRYPLVIQTHGFAESEFRPSGVYPTAFAARALTAAGIVVLQADEQGCPVNTPAEGPCAVSSYEAAANQLVSEGVVDPQKIGIIGFSRSCFGVLEMLTMASLHLKAASITDGWLMTYSHYLLDEGPPTGDDDQLDDKVIGAKPFGEGLKLWLKRSPGFNLDKLSTPLLVVGEGPVSLLGMWEPYAGLRYLHKPVDMILLNTDEHVLTNPAVRMASQGSAVDWFRFWLQDYEDPDPVKSGQYARWRDLRKLQSENEHKLAPR
jgi:hypothetical protein